MGQWTSNKNNSNNNIFSKNIKNVVENMIFGLMKEITYLHYQFVHYNQ